MDSHDVYTERERLRERCEAYKGQVESGAHEIERLRDRIASLHSALRGATDYLECIDKANPDLVVSIHGLYPIKEMVERYRAALGDQQLTPQEPK